MKKLLLAVVAAMTLGTGAQAADLGSPRMPIAAAVVAPVFNWSGFYLGAHVGYGWGRTTANNGLIDIPANTHGPLIGGQIGFNYQINQIVLGVEADLALAAVMGRPAANPAIYYRTSALGSLRARAGFAVNRALIYATGGLALHNSLVGQGGTNDRAWRMGWTIGAGVEYALTQNWTAKVEYSYANFGTRTIGNGLCCTARTDIHTVKLGVNYLFSTGPSAVVARY